MKYRLITFFVIGLFTKGLAQTKLPVIIEGQLNGPILSKVYIERLNERNVRTALDSINVNGDHFVFKTAIPEPGLYQLNIANQYFATLILDGNEHLKAVVKNAESTDAPAILTVDGSKNMATFFEILKLSQKMFKVNKDFDAKYNAAMTNSDKEIIKKEAESYIKTNRDIVFNKTKELGTTMAGIIATNNFLSPEEYGEYRIHLKDQLVAEKKNSYFAKMYIMNAVPSSGGVVGSDAPDFELVDLKGNLVKLSDFKGKTVIIDFWATWCGPCIMSFPGMKMAKEKYKNDPDVVFLFIDTFERVSETQWSDHVANFVKSKGFEFANPILDIGNNAASRFGVNGIPAKFCIGKDGKIKYKSAGYRGSAEATLQEMIEWVGK